jgi:hypothetical protein
MKIRRRASPVLLFLLPSLASLLVSATSDNTQSNLANNGQARNAKVLAPTPTADLGPLIKPTARADVGTKDAPVDGKDGKPHAGPFVDTDRKKTKAEGEDAELVLKNSAPVLKDVPADTTRVDGVPIPEVNDGVMNDPDRKTPKQGTTGTEGGVSEKNKVQKAQEGQTGEKVEKKPNSPKEAPPLPHSEEQRLQTEKSKDSKKPKPKDGDGIPDDTSELSGLEVCSCPNHMGE